MEQPKPGPSKTKAAKKERKAPPVPVTQKEIHSVKTETEQPEAGPSSMETVQSSEKQRNLTQAQTIWRKVKEFTEEERFNLGVGSAELKTQLGLLEMGFELLLKVGGIGGQLPEYCRLKNILGKKMEATAEKKTNTIFVSVENDFELPKFMGSFGDWPDFVNEFRVKVADKQHLSGAEKLLKLQQCLNAEAKYMIQKFSLRDEDAFQKAWQRLNDHYLKSCDAFSYHIRQIFSIKPISHGDAATVEAVIEKVQSSVEIATAAAQPGSTGLSHAAAVYLTSMMDYRTREQWTMNRSDPKKIPLLEEVTTFYLIKARTWEENKDEARRRYNARRSYEDVPKIKSEFPDQHQENDRKRSYQQMASSKTGGKTQKKRKGTILECFRCHGAHKLSACELFAKESLESREDFVTKRNICTVCYSATHAETSCAIRCFRCKERHLIAFCPILKPIQKDS